MIGLSPSTYYLKPRKSRLEKAKEEIEIKEAIGKIRKDLPIAGYRTLLRYLKREHGIVIGETKLRRIIGENRLQARQVKRFAQTTMSAHDEMVHPNLIPEMTVTDVNQVWVADITYIRILTGFVYLAAVLDVYSRKVIGWAISTSLDRRVACQALQMAINNRKPKPGTIHHSDRGVQYLCKEYVGILDRNKFHMSCSRKGNPYDNAFAESFFKTLKSNEVDLKKYRDVFDVIERVPEFLADIYNERRVHSALDYLSPNEFEEKNEKDKQKGNPRPTLKL